MLYATDGINDDADFEKAMVGVASVWYEGNPCNKHLLGLGQTIKQSLVQADLIGYQFGTVGVSDGISMGTRGMTYSLQSRDLIADQVETAAGGHHLDGMVVVPGCDKNMPGVLMARKFHSNLRVSGLTVLQLVGLIALVSWCTAVLSAQDHVKVPHNLTLSPLSSRMENTSKMARHLKQNKRDTTSFDTRVQVQVHAVAFVIFSIYSTPSLTVITDVYRKYHGLSG